MELHDATNAPLRYEGSNSDVQRIIQGNYVPGGTRSTKRGNSVRRNSSPGMLVEIKARGMFGVAWEKEYA